jgi:hypothetical protein
LGAAFFDSGAGVDTGAGVDGAIAADFSSAPSADAAALARTGVDGTTSFFDEALISFFGLSSRVFSRDRRRQSNKMKAAPMTMATMICHMLKQDTRTQLKTKQKHLKLFFVLCFSSIR